MEGRGKLFKPTQARMEGASGINFLTLSFLWTDSYPLKNGRNYCFEKTNNSRILTQLYLVYLVCSKLLQFV